MATAINYVTGGQLTTLARVRPSALAHLPSDPVDICRLVPNLVIQPSAAKDLCLPAERFSENQLRPAARLIDALLSLDPAPLTVAREPERRVIGTCRHFAVLSCALLRHREIPARARCGFATYFQPGRGVDHWITEYWHDADGRWVRIDPEIVNDSIVARPEDLAAGDFLTGGEAWAAFRAGHIDAAHFGVYGTENWGPGEIRGNAIRDLAALNKLEMLPWDEWGRMDASYRGETGADYDALMDTVAAVCASDDLNAVADLYASAGADLEVPTDLVN
ncbi:MULTISPECIES: transglutaminase-like domain-containing protein [unclassified Micromonospora]|uniref:transglutaminase-like domain-containing protein n=1 Tax=unclassified Micromonospora TaxID=2617518 RepID=UPI000EF45B6E|nr:MULTISPECIES: transglutaminase-like domain-containing protein [unclassified Micromonospora]RLP88832.1 transglutaminase domain-containing protein [Micromonospora sp. BL4]RLP95303.1 transglutaminase domain-containing protein [Micromonospora sp. CV4]